MTMPMTLKEYLEACDIDYEELPHPREITASRIAETSKIAGDRMAKAVMLHSDSGYRLAVIPSSCDADLDQLSRMLHEKVSLASEQQIMEHFRDCDCDPGATSPVGQAWGLQVYVDDMLRHQPDVYFDAGDHETLVHMSGREFDRLMHDSPHGRFSRHY